MKTETTTVTESMLKPASHLDQLLASTWTLRPPALQSHFYCFKEEAVGAIHGNYSSDDPRQRVAGGPSVVLGGLSVVLGGSSVVLGGPSVVLGGPV